MYDQNKVDEFFFRSEELIGKVDKEEAFSIITKEIEDCEDQYFNEYITVLSLIRNDKVLDWIEINIHRTVNIGQNWGHLVASSYLSWSRAEKWLSAGRPLCLVALDGIMFCTTVGERLNQSLWMREIQPKLIDNPKPEIVATRLQKHLQIDNTHLTKTIINKIIENLFDARQ
ncbi:hypothetical protein [Flectobacillus roseus]|uniref:Uncharacterized protein n=1 Tax=Flectobacillus roseus TaxID=502259 RepID=A0ABT6Y8N7_9BACT|nr:hypothetical protein [Flectobacillus roseus]MDI9859483.1 hypothetical protein [Flectobacillus roseus]